MNNSSSSNTKWICTQAIISVWNHHPFQLKFGFDSIALPLCDSKFYLLVEAKEYTLTIARRKLHMPHLHKMCAYDKQIIIIIGKIYYKHDFCPLFLHSLSLCLPRSLIMVIILLMLVAQNINRKKWLCLLLHRNIYVFGCVIPIVLIVICLWVW